MSKVKNGKLRVKLLYVFSCCNTECGQETFVVASLPYFVLYFCD